MSYVPNDTRVVNTVISGSSMVSNLSGADVRLLEFDAANRRAAAKVLANGDNTLVVNQWLQSAIDTQLLDGAALSATGFINLGPDAGSQAAAYVSLFNLQSTSDERLLRVALNKTPTGSIGLRNSSGTTTRVTTSVNVGGAAAASVSLFSLAAAAQAPTGPYNYGAGAERLIVVTAGNVDAGSETVNFAVLPYSA